MAANGFPGYSLIGVNDNGSLNGTQVDEVPDCIAKTKNSIGCLLKTSDIKNHIDLFRQSNFDFIKSAIKTHQLPQIR